MDLNIYYGIKTGYNEAFIISKETRNQLIDEDTKSRDVIKPFISGKDIKPWQINYNDKYVLYIPWKFPIDDYPAIKKHLLKFKDNLKKRPEVKDGRGDWFALSRYASDYVNKFEEDKLIYPEISPKLFFGYDSNKFLTNKTCFIITSDTINLKFLSAIVSSKVLNFVFSFMGSTLEGKRFNLSKSLVEQLPVYPATSEQQKPFIEKSNKMLQLNSDLIEEIKGFKDWLQRTYNIDKFTLKLHKYYKLSLDDFLDELKKKKVDTNQRKTQELLKETFEESVTKINPLLEEIEKTDNEIDQMVYELYGLTEDEIKIVEKSL